MEVAEKNLDVRIIEPRFKHPTIFSMYDSLASGESFTITNDHDPAPLYYQFLAERPNGFEWEYLERGPEVWRVRIGKAGEGEGAGEKELTIGQIAAKDHRKAMVFKKLGLDFCCGGKKTLREATAEKGLDLTTVKAVLEAVESDNGQDQAFSQMSVEELINYIVERHHQFLADNFPDLKAVLEKVVMVHSASHPELINLHAFFCELEMEIFDHMRKEEELFFPFMIAIEKKLLAGATQDGVGKMENSVGAMEDEHEQVGKILASMNELTDGYKIPGGACGSYRLLYNMLKDVENDIIQHIHLENNILFPKAKEQEKQLLAK